MKQMSVGGGFPSHLDTPPLDCQTSESDEEVDGPPCNATPTSQNADAATPMSGWGKKRMWRRKRRQSNSKDDKSATGFLDKITNSDRLTRKQALPALMTMSRELLDDPAATPTLLDEPATAASRDSTPKPRHAATPITLNGSFSPEVEELIESVRHPFRHRRNDSGGSIRQHRRQGSNGSIGSGRGQSLEATPLRGHSIPTTASSSKRASAEVGGPRHGSNSGVPYTRMDTSYSESDEILPANAVVSLLVPETEGGGRRPPKDLHSNESSMDTHGSDEGGNEADGESTSDGYENQLHRFSETEPNETTETTESYMESSPVSTSQAESDELASCSAAGIMEPDAAAILIPNSRSEVSGYGSGPGDAMATPVTLHRGCSPSPSDHDVTVVMSCSQSASPDASVTALSMPLHMRTQEMEEGAYEYRRKSV